MTDDFVSEVGPHNPFGLLATSDTGKVVSVSAKGMCSASPDTCHHWVSDGIGAQSIEVLHCLYCKERIYD